MIARLAPQGYVEAPWPNGKGTNFHIGHEKDVWWFSRTPIKASGEFSDYGGYDRMQALIEGPGLMLDTPDGLRDVRVPFEVVCFDGRLGTNSRLEGGEVVIANLIGRRDKVEICLKAYITGSTFSLSPGIHFIHAPTAPASLTCGGASYVLEHDHALRIEPAEPSAILIERGRVLVASILPFASPEMIVP
ncbi:MAG: hypothetical protein JWQ58_2687 [Reyranella sp.]|nr:hypothetical protein [Reyranella sp.]